MSLCVMTEQPNQPEPIAYSDTAIDSKTGGLLSNGDRQKLYGAFLKTVFNIESGALGDWIYNSPVQANDSCNGFQEWENLITNHPGYYLYRSESDFIEHVLAREARRIVGPIDCLYELGGGGRMSAIAKTRHFVDVFSPIKGFYPIDISPEALRDVQDYFSKTHPDLRVEGVVANYFEQLPPFDRNEANAILFLGSTISNLCSPHGTTFNNNERLKGLFGRIAANSGPQTSLILTHDCNDDLDELTRSYDSDHLRALIHSSMHLVKRELYAPDFDPSLFEIRSVWDAEKRLMQHQIVATQDQTFILKPFQESKDSARIELKKGQTLKAVNSYKPSMTDVTNLLVEAGWREVGEPALCDEGRIAGRIFRPVSHNELNCFG